MANLLDLAYPALGVRLGLLGLGDDERVVLALLALCSRSAGCGRLG